MFLVANEKQRESVALITRHFLQHLFTACFCYYTLSPGVNYTSASECAIYAAAIIPRELLVRDETHQKKLTKSYNGKKSYFVLLTSLHLKKNKIKKNNSCTFPEGGRRVLFMKPDNYLP